jgi:hypothetical protein
LFAKNSHETAAPGNSGKQAERQNEFARWQMEHEIELLLALTELAVTVEAVQMNPKLWPLVHASLRQCNAKLLASLSPEAKRFENRTRSADDDLRAVLSGASAENASIALKAYNAARENLG